MLKDSFTFFTAKSASLSCSADRTLDNPLITTAAVGNVFLRLSLKSVGAVTVGANPADVVSLSVVVGVDAAAEAAALVAAAAAVNFALTLVDGIVDDIADDITDDVDVTISVPRE